MNQKLIKVCGMRQSDNIRAVEALGIHWMGFIFWAGSSRYVAAPPSYLPVRCKRVGVFVDASIDTVLTHISDYGLDAVQLHGQEAPDYLRQLRSRCQANSNHTEVPCIIKAFSIATTADLAPTSKYEDCADLYLFDTKGNSIGGTGRQFNWKLLDNYAGPTPFLLSGGIGPEDACPIHQFSHPRCIGIDLNSRFELAPGLKDIQRLQSFIKQYEQD